MAYFQDLSPCTYFGEDRALIAVGWLERGRKFKVAECDPRVYRRLVEFSNNAWQPLAFAGVHNCEFCQYEPEHGSANIFIPSTGFLYVCPELICHYMNAHGYGPPVEFCKAVLDCPPIRSMEYLKAVLANGGKTLDKPPNTST